MKYGEFWLQGFTSNEDLMFWKKKKNYLTFVLVLFRSLKLLFFVFVLNFLLDFLNQYPLPYLRREVELWDFSGWVGPAAKNNPVAVDDFCPQHWVGAWWHRGYGESPHPEEQSSSLTEGWPWAVKTLVCSGPVPRNVQPGVWAAETILSTNWGKGARDLGAAAPGMCTSLFLEDLGI